MPTVTFVNKDRAFINSIKSKVDDYFKDKNLSTHGNSALYTKSLILIPAAIACYVAVVFFPVNAVLALFLCALLGLISAGIGFNVMHDACHGSYSSKKWINETMALSLNVLGGNAFLWKIKHNIIHHTYTNVDGLDDDIAKMPVIRQCESQPHKRFHKYQHIYGVLVYALSSFLWVFLMDFMKYFGKKVYNTPVSKIETKEHVIFWMSKVLYIVVYIAVPVYFVGWLPWVIGFFTMHVIMGLTLAMVFQLAHVVEITQFVDANNGEIKIADEWAIHQVNTTANFATSNKLLSWYVGGLNFQIEHHLFPKISHVHYPAISRFVKESCEAFGVGYQEFPTLTSAVNSHFRFMKHLGKA